uniref:hypothetical protein n=1 Tax=Pseudomonas laurentiana TaxID=2364649 RepID=UPI00167ABECF|nr:hypothetical protein [Pseudomonas laurentiana]
MEKNYLVWGTVEALVSAYKVLNENGDIVPDDVAQEISRRRQVSLRKFFHDNDLLCVKAFDDEGRLIDRCYYKEDFTDEGEELRKRKVDSWIKAKASSKAPPDLRILEKALAEIRTRK